MTGELGWVSVYHGQSTSVLWSSVNNDDDVEVARLAAGTPVMIIAEPVTHGGFKWFNVATPQGTGWLRGTRLRLVNGDWMG